MKQCRKDLVIEAFHKLDKSGDGTVTSDDLKGVYKADQHKKYKSGEWTEDDVFQDWLNKFNGPDNYSGEVSERLTD